MAISHSSSGSANAAGTSTNRPQPIGDLRRFAIHTVTTKPWPIETAIDAYARAGFGGLSIWRDAMEGRSPSTVKRQVAEAGLTGVSLVRGGFFAHTDATARTAAIEDNRRCIQEAHDLDLPLIVLVCGADQTVSLAESRKMITDALVELAPEAAAAGVRLGIEPLHPMYADTRSAVNTLSQANRIAGEVNRVTAPSITQPAALPTVCSVVDVYHLWWDEELPEAITDAGNADILAAFHVCDWRVPTEHMLLDRGLMGEGVIDIPGIRSHVETAGFHGFIEVEIFSERYWAMDQAAWLNKIADACRTAV